MLFIDRSAVSDEYHIVKYGRTKHRIQDQLLRI